MNLASLGFGHAPRIIEACQRSGVERVIAISTTAIFTRLSAESKSVRLDAESAFESSGLAYTVLRPTMIYGTLGDRNISRLIRALHRYPVFPVFGTGDRLQQPVHVEDVASAVIACLAQGGTVRRSYNVPGREALSYSQMIDTICGVLGKRVAKVRVPLGVAAALAVALGVFSRKPWISAEQIHRLDEDKCFDYSAAETDFGYSPRTFRDGVEPLVRDVVATGG